jgi:hypothetical protein
MMSENIHPSGRERDARTLPSSMVVHANGDDWSRPPGAPAAQVPEDQQRVELQALLRLGDPADRERITRAYRAELGSEFCGESPEERRRNVVRRLGGFYPRWEKNALMWALG